jgi:hypothetical protein
MGRRIVNNVWATNAGRTSTPSPSRSAQGWEGFPAVPNAKEQNFLENLTTEFLDNISKNGIPEWISTETYPANSVCLYNGAIYKSLQASNINKTPGSQPLWWDLYQTQISNDNSISGFVPISGTDPDEELTLSVGNALCEDGINRVSLDSTETDLNLATLKGSALSNSVSGYLARYKKNDGTNQWHFEENTTSLTISDIISAGAYRIVAAVRTDSSGDIIAYDAIETSGGGLEISMAQSTISMNFGSLSPQLLQMFIPQHIDTVADAYVQMRSAQGPTDINVFSNLCRNKRVGTVAALGTQDDVTCGNNFKVMTDNGQATFDLVNATVTGNMFSQGYTWHRRIQ